MTGRPEDDEDARRRGVSRRGLLGFVGAGTVGVAVGATGGWAAAQEAAEGSAGGAPYPFYGRHQAGIVTPAQDRLHFAAFDLSETAGRTDLQVLLQAWTSAAASMTRGQPVGGGTSLSYESPPADTGEAVGLPPSGLTLTFGFGPSLFRDRRGSDRFGLAGRRPRALRDLPHFAGDALDPRRTGGDLCVQACADDPQVAVHAIRNLSRIAFGTAVIRWAQLGFGRTSSTSTTQATPRNLFGFKDGTANLKAEDPGKLDRHVWVTSGDDPRADWLTGGTYLVARRISMHIETWDRAPLQEQETIVGRDRVEGAPLSGGSEFSEPDFGMRGRGGVPLIDPASHVRLAHPSSNAGVEMLRRGYNFTDGADRFGLLDAGLFFIAFVRDPDSHYIPMQTRLAQDDLMMEYLQHTGSGLWAVPPGARRGSYVGAGLFS